MASVRVRGNLAALINPDTGGREWVSVDRVPDLLGQGWEAEAPGQPEREWREMVYGGTGGGITAGALGLARGATLGMSDLLYRAAGIEPRTLHAFQEENPKASFAGEAAGMVGSAFVPFSPIAQIGRGGAAIAGGITARAGGGLGAKVLGKAAGGMAEGAAVAGMMGATEPHRDPTAKVADMFKRASEGALLGAGFNVAAMGVPALGRFVGRHYRKAADKLGLGIEEMATDAKTVRLSKRHLQALRDKAAGASDDTFVDPAAGIGGTRTYVDPGVQYGPKGATVPDYRNLRQTMGGTALADTRLAGTGGAKSEGFGTAARRAVAYEKAGLGTAAETPAAKAAGRAAPTNLSAEAEPLDTAVAKLQAELAKKAGAAEGAPYLSVKEAKEAVKLHRQLEKARERAAKRVANWMRRVAERETAYGVRRGRGLGGHAAGAGLGAVIGGDVIHAVVGGIVGPAAIKAAHWALWNAGKLGAKAAAHPISKILAPGVRGAITMTPEEYEDLRDEMVENTPDQVHDRATLMLPSWFDDENAQRLKADTVQALSYLHAKMPKPAPGQSPEGWSPSQTAMDDWALRIRAAVDRESPVRDFARGQLTEPARETFFALEPEAAPMFAQWVEKQVLARRALGETLPQSLLKQAALLTGNPEMGPAIDHPAVVLTLQDSFEEAMQGGVQPAPQRSVSRGPLEMSVRSLSRLDSAIERMK